MKHLIVVVALLGTGTYGVAAQQRFDDVIRNLRNPDFYSRMAALRLLRDSKVLDAISPIAPLVNDSEDEIQLEAIATELSFYLVDPVDGRKRVAFIVETRRGGKAEAAFDAGPLAVWPRPVPAELVSHLLRAIDDQNPRVRHDAIYALGTIARPPVSDETTQQLIRALDHYDPAIRAAAARVVGRLRVAGAGQALIKAVNDSQQPVRFAAMRALGEIGEATAIQALTQQLDHYRKGEGAWSALDGLARIGHPSSVPLFTARLSDRDPWIRRAAAEGLGRAGDRAAIASLEAAAGTDSSEMARAAMNFALQKLGRNYVPRLVESLDSDKLVDQVGGYLIELGAPIADALVPHLKDPDPSIRGNVATVLGAVAGDAHVAALQALASDRDRDVVRAAGRAVERIKMRGSHP
jgi:HEAT repeat protein